MMFMLFEVEVMLMKFEVEVKLKLLSVFNFARLVSGTFSDPASGVQNLTPCVGREPSSRTRDSRVRRLKESAG